MRIRINAYNAGSASARALSERLTELTGQRVLRLRNPTSFRPREDDVVINYGIPRVQLPAGAHRTFNAEEHIRLVTNKLRFFEYIAGTQAGINIPEFTTSQEVASQWVAEGHKVCCRTNLTGHSADGLVLARTQEELVLAPLYTKYVPKKDEYRVHFVGDTITDVQRKARRLDTPNEEVNWQVRNHDNGFIYMRDGVNNGTVPAQVLQQAARVAAIVPLTFGSIDILWNRRNGSATVLEVNSASGLEGTTLERFSNAVLHLIQGRNPTPWGLLTDVQRDEEENPEEEAIPAEEEQPATTAEPVMPDHVQQELENDLAFLQQSQQAYERYVRAQREYEEVRVRMHQTSQRYGTHVPQHAINHIRSRLATREAPQQALHQELEVLI